MKKRAPFVLLLLICLLGAGTRLTGLDTRSLWEDEGWTLVLIESSDLPTVVRTLALDQHPPLFFIFQRLWRDATGESELALRLFSAFVGLLSVAVLYQVGRALWGAKVGLIAASLLAVWDFPIDVAQDARQYSLLLLFSLLSTLFYLRYLRQAGRGTGLAWWAFSVAALYTQYLAVFVLAWQALYLFLVPLGRPRWGDFALRFALIGLAFAPWLPIFIHQNQVRWTDPIYYQSGLPNTRETFVLIRDALVTRQFGLVLGLVGLGLLAKPRRVALGLALWVFFYIAILAWLNQNREILRIRIFILAVPPLLLLIAGGLAQLEKRAMHFLLAVLLGVSLFTVDSRQQHAPWREVVEQVTPWHRADEPILLDVWVGDFPARYYVRRQMGDSAPWLSLRELARQKGDFFLPALAVYLGEQAAFWLIRWGDEAKDYDGLLNDLGYQRTASSFIDHLGNPIYAYRYDRLEAASLGRFGDSLDLLKADIQMGSGEVGVSLWWVAREALPLDYSVSVFAQDAEGNILIQQDNAPLNGAGRTSTWIPEQIYFDSYRLRLPPSVAPDRLKIGVRVYWYAEPQKPLPVTGARAMDESALWLPLKDIP
jgi:hypothetical protein